MSTPRASRILELGGLALALAAFAIFLWDGYGVLAASDPVQWYSFGRHFAEDFGTRRLAYGFPLLVSGAVAALGPVRAYLVNVAVLIALAGLVYLFGVRQGPTRDAVARVGGAVALLLFALWNAEELLVLVNPYRDPLAYVLSLGACLLAVRATEGAGGARGLAAGAGACLALACSTREASGLLLGPLALFAVVSRWRDPKLPFIGAACAFGAAFALLLSPWLVQNAVVSGSALVPAQASSAFEASGDLVPGVATSNLRESLPATLEYIGDHYGPVGLALLALGVLGAVFRRAPVSLALTLPALLAFGLFYAGYNRVVPRYLVVLDLFAAPLAGAGVAAPLALALRAAREPARTHLARLALGVAFATAVLALLTLGRPSERRFRIPDAERLRRDLPSFIPPDAHVVAARPVASLLKTFFDYDVATLTVTSGHKTLLDPEQRADVRDVVRAGRDTVVASRTDLPARDPVRRFLASEFDLEPMRALPTEPYGLDERLRSDAIYLDRVVPWTTPVAEAPVFAEHPGRYVLAVDVGRLSRRERGFALLEFGGRALDRHPRDRINYYQVDVDRPGSIPVRLRSDAPVPSVLLAALYPEGEPLVLNFGDFTFLNHLPRFSESFLHEDADRPGLSGSGTVDVPTVAPDGALFVVLGQLSVHPHHRGRRHRLAVRAGGRTLYEAQLPEGSAPGPARFSFALLPGTATEPDTRLHWEIAGPPEPEAQPLVSLEQLRIYRHELGPSLRIDLASPRAEKFEVFGLYAAPEGAGGSWRWTSGRAVLRVFAPPGVRANGGRRPRLAVSYLVGARPPDVSPPVPRFTWNGRPLGGRIDVEALGALHRVTQTFDLSRDMFRDVLNVLAIESSTWVPREAGVSDDPRQLGIMLESVTLETGT